MIRCACIFLVFLSLTACDDDLPPPQNAGSSQTQAQSQSPDPDPSPAASSNDNVAQASSDCCAAASGDGNSGHEQIVEEGLNKIGEVAKCNTRCNTDDITCLAECPGGRAGSSCHANCALEQSNCVMGCSN